MKYVNHELSLKKKKKKSIVMLKGRSTACHYRKVNILWNVYLMSKITSKLSEEDSGSKCTIFLKTPSSTGAIPCKIIYISRKTIPDKQIM